MFRKKRRRPPLDRGGARPRRLALRVARSRAACRQSGPRLRASTSWLSSRWRRRWHSRTTHRARVRGGPPNRRDASRCRARDTDRGDRARRGAPRARARAKWSASGRCLRAPRPLSAACAGMSLSTWLCECPRPVMESTTKNPTTVPMITIGFAPRPSRWCTVSARPPSRPSRWNAFPTRVLARETRQTARGRVRRVRKRRHGKRDEQPTPDGWNRCQSLSQCTTALGSMWREKRVLARSRPPRRAEREAHAIYRREDRRRPQRTEHARRSQTRARPLDSFGRRPGAPRARARRDRAFFNGSPADEPAEFRAYDASSAGAPPPPPFSA